MRTIAVRSVLTLLVTAAALPAAPVPVAGTMTWQQNFDSLGTGSPAWVDDATLPGWYAQMNNGATPAGNVQASNGTVSTQAGLLNLGTTGGADRALGSKATSTGNLANIAYAVQFQNTGSHRVLVTRLAYTGEIWRTNDGGTGFTESYTAYYGTSATAITNIASGASSSSASPGAGFTALGLGANWISPSNQPANTPLDGNADANRVRVSFLPSYLFLDPGAFLTIKWTDANRSGGDGYQGLDDVEVEFTSMEGMAGGLDTGFTPDINPDISLGRVQGIAVQLNGQIVIGGEFWKVGAATRNYIARLQSNGALDTGFDPNAAEHVNAVVLAPDGKLLLGGGFGKIGGTERYGIARINANGSLDTSFHGPALFGYGVICMRPQPNGQIVVGGSFDGLPDPRLRRVSATGSLDAAFNPTGNGAVGSVSLEADGRMVVSGYFTTLNGVTRNRVGRYNADGTLDPGYNPDVNGSVRCLARQADGKVLIGGQFTSVSGVTRQRIARLQQDGSLDESFSAEVDDIVNSIVLQADGRIIMGGFFRTVGGNPRRGVARLFPDGTMDASFRAYADGDVYSVALQGDGRVLVSGDFNRINGTVQRFFARVENHPVTQSLTALDGHRVRWMRGGAAPELEKATIDLSTNGGTVWTSLGAATRIPGGWEASSVGVPASGHLRARGQTAGGYGGNSGGLVETISAYALSALEEWRYSHFGTTSGTGPAADNADPDKDGLENLVEFAFAGNPNVPDATLPQWQLSDDDYSLTFTQPAGVSGITYVAEYSTSLAPGSWTPAVNVSTPPAYTFFAPAITQRLYLRVRVTAP